MEQCRASGDGFDLAIPCAEGTQCRDRRCVVLDPPIGYTDAWVVADVDVAQEGSDSRDTSAGDVDSGSGTDGSVGPSTELRLRVQVLQSTAASFVDVGFCEGGVPVVGGSSGFDAACRNSVFARLAPRPAGLEVSLLWQASSGVASPLADPMLLNLADIVELRFTVLDDPDPTRRWVQALAFALLGNSQAGGTVQVDAGTTATAGLWNLENNESSTDALQGVVSALTATGLGWGQTATPEFIGLATQQGDFLQTTSPAPWFTFYASNSATGWALLAAPTGVPSVP